MGNLTSIPLSETMPTFEILEKHGVEQEDMRFIRKYPDFAFAVATTITSVRRNYYRAIAKDEKLALGSVVLISDRVMLEEIASNRGAVVSVRLEAVRQTTDQNRLYNIARNAYDEFEVACAAMLRITDSVRLDHLQAFGSPFWSEWDGLGLEALKARRIMLRMNL